MCERKDDFVVKAIAVHGDTYDYSKVVYTNNRTKVEIMCKKHGVFEQRPDNHLAGKGCARCANDKAHSTKDKFVAKAITIHGDRYNYEQVIYTNLKGKVKIVCEKHGVFEQRVADHLDGKGCVCCANDKTRSTKDKFVAKSIEVHGELYDYSKVVYTNNKEKVKIVCKKHGIFEQRVMAHLSGKGCSCCANDKTRSTKDDFVAKAIAVHGELYDYSKVVYTNNKEKVKIVCEKHGVFEQRVFHHLRGNGCPSCCSSKGEIAVAKALNNYGISFKEQAKFLSCRGKSGSKLRFDFYIASLNLVIEFDGIQHFQSMKIFGGKTRYLTQRVNDSIKNTYCESHGISMLRIKDGENIEEAISNMLDIISADGYGCVFYGKQIIHENWLAA